MDDECDERNAALVEREKIVAFVKAEAALYFGLRQMWFEEIAKRIENGDHE